MKDGGGRGEGRKESLADKPGAPNENIVQNHFNIASLNVF